MDLTNEIEETRLDIVSELRALLDSFDPVEAVDVTGLGAEIDLLAY